MSITKSQTEKVGSIFKGNRFVIPSYQRKYNWTDTERKDLWQDIEESIKDNMNHFLGTLSFKESKSKGLETDTVYEIIDGQQRITTLYILLFVLIGRIENQTTRKTLMTSFIGEKDDLKLKAQGADGSFLSELLFDSSIVDPAKITKRSQRFLYDALKLFNSFSKLLTQQDIEKRIIFIRDNIEVLVFNVESQAQAVKMFSIINDRGLPLRILDKTKSILMLYSTLHLDERLNAPINDRFEKIFDAYDDLLITRDRLAVLSRIEENTIFTQHYYSSRKLFAKTWNNRHGAETIFNNLKDKCEELKETPDELSRFIQEYLSDFESFAVSYSKLIAEIGTKVSYQKPFLFLDFSAPLYPLIVRLYMQDKLDDLLALLESIEVRIYKLRGTGPVADMYMISSMVAEKYLSIQEIRTYLIAFSEKFVNDHVFATYLDGPIAGNGAVKYILLEHANQSFPREVYKTFQTEHIFSSNPEFEPAAYGFSEDYDYDKGRIGNLCLLEQGLNAGLQNLAPLNKVDGYLQSAIHETQGLADEIQNGGFDKTNVDERRKQIIEFCLHRFAIR